MKQFLRKIIRKCGYDVVSFDPRFNFQSRKTNLLIQHQINHTLDVGANVGQFGKYLRKIGYAGKITSFEPMSEAFNILKSLSQSDNNWATVCAGLGAKEESRIINITRDSFSSSINEVSPAFLKINPDTNIISQEKVMIKTLDSLFDNYVELNSNVLLKIDTQGFESEVLAGASESLKKIDIIILEMSLEPLYIKQELFSVLIDKIYELGYKAAILEPCCEDYDNLTILQMDGWFIKATNL